MAVKVAILPVREDYSEVLKQGLDLIGGIEDLNDGRREVTIKVGIFDPRSPHHASVPVVRAIADAFDQAKRVYLAESDNYCGKSLERLGRYQELFSERVIPFSLTDDKEIRKQAIAGEEMGLAHILFKPNVLISTHVLRTFPKGSILKNLFGCTPMVKKAKYHKDELFHALLADIFAAVGGIDLAVLDGTYLYFNATEKKVRLNTLVIGRDAVAVETMGFALAGLKPEKSPVIQEFVRRGLGEGDLRNIEIVGVSQDEFAQLKRAHKELKALVKAAPRLPGISSTIDQLTQEGWLDAFRSIPEVVEALQGRGVANANNAIVETTLRRRLGKTLERSRNGGGWVYRRKQD